ncbi:MAG: CopG family transcriptional regulator [Acidimicrobiales bacterium]
MRTTLNLDDDVLVAIKERARREGRSSGEVLSELARQALTNRGPLPQGAEPASFHGFEPLPHRGPAVSNALIDRLRENERE